MRWKDGRRSENVEDRRSMTPAVAGAGGVGVIIMALIAVFMGGDPKEIVQRVQKQQQAAREQQQAQPQATDPAQDELAQMVSVVLADTEDVWHRIFAEEGKQYVEPTLVLFSRSVESACGHASAAVGPFYCPADQKVYIDLGFYDDLRTRHAAPGDFAQAYVIAHEIGHHVQNLLGISDQVHQLQQTLPKAEGNQYSTRLELQADFLAGVWAHHAHKARGILESGDVEEALNAANAIGDDTLQKQAQGYVVPDSFTHGTSAQRVKWFREGLVSGKLSGGDALFKLPYDEL